MTTRPILTIGDLGVRLAAARQFRGLTQAALAERARVSRQWVSAVESGRRMGVEFASVLRVVAALDLRLELRAPGPPAVVGTADADEPEHEVESYLHELGVL